MSYSHAEHAARCREAAQSNTVLCQYVQTKVGGQLACARIADAWTNPEGVDLWRLDLLGPFRGLFYVTTNRVRPCSGIDGRCICAGEGAAGPAGEAKPQAGPAAPSGRDVLVTRHFSPKNGILSRD